MRPIIWGIIVFFVCGMLWLMSTIFAVIEQWGGHTGVFTVFMLFTMLGCLFSLPVAIVAEILRWRRRRKEISSSREK